MSKFRLKTGDHVMIIAGKDRGKQGKIVQTFPRLSRVVVEGVHVVKRHLRTRRAGEAGRIIDIAMPIHASNAQLIAVDGKPMRHNKRVHDSTHTTI